MPSGLAGATQSQAANTLRVLASRPPRNEQSASVPADGHQDQSEVRGTVSQGATVILYVSSGPQKSRAIGDRLQPVQNAESAITGGRPDRVGTPPRRHRPPNGQVLSTNPSGGDPRWLQAPPSIWCCPTERRPDDNDDRQFPQPRPHRARRPQRHNLTKLDHHHLSTPESWRATSASLAPRQASSAAGRARKLASKLGPFGVEDRLGVELHSLDRQGRGAADP